MPSDNILKYGILKCRDLVELVYGARMVTSIIEKSFSASATPYLILGQDPRRIRYEVWLNQNGTAVGYTVFMGSPAAIDSGTAQGFWSFTLGYVYLARDFLTDGEAVCLPLKLSDPNGQILVTTRETFLTPAPVDEVPLG